MIYKIQDCDLLKLVPRIDADGKPQWITEVDCISATITKGSSVYPLVIYDLESKWARKLTLEHSKRGGKSHYAKKYFANALVKGEIVVVSFGRSLMKIITENSILMDISSNCHLIIKMEVRNSYPSFDKSHPVRVVDWKCPVSDLNSQEEWMSFLKNNQPDFETYMKGRDMNNRRDDMIQIFGDLMSEVIADDRNNKLDKLGI